MGHYFLEMVDNSPPHTWITPVALRISSSSGSPLAPPKASPCVLDLLVHGRSQAHVGEPPTI
jgi:hypothetical protein